MALDLAVSRAITMVHILERALHAQDPWLMRLDDTVALAQRMVEDHRVVFTAEFPPLKSTGNELLSLYCGEDLVLARPIKIASPTDDPFVAEWALALPQGVAA